MRSLWIGTMMLALTSAGMGGCQTDAQTGALLGSALGAAAGAGIDHRDRGRGALIGAAGGGAAGYMIGNESDKNQARRHRYDY